MSPGRPASRAGRGSAPDVGTSADRTSGSGGAWTPLKHAATAYAKAASGGAGGSRSTAERVLGRHVAVLGGAGAAARGARSGSAGLSRLGGLLAGVGSSGLGPALTERGLSELVGRDRFDVLDELITLVAGDAADVESQAARDAACDVLDELYAEADTWEELESTEVTPESLRTLLTLFLAKYVYNRLPVLAERLARLMDPAAAKAADQQIVSMIHDLVELRMPEDPFGFDWGGAAGQQFADDAIRDVYEIIGDLGDEGDA